MQASQHAMERANEQTEEAMSNSIWVDNVTDVGTDTDIYADIDIEVDVNVHISVKVDVTCRVFKGIFINDNVNLDEGSSTRLGSFKFFSRDTHTIYTPRLEAVWNSHVWNTGSLQNLDASDLEDLQIFSTNLKTRYTTDFDGKIRIVGRPNNPTLSNSPTASAYSIIKYLPTGSQYSVIDNYTDDVIIPYGTGSYISCDSRGNYIDLNTSGLQTQREYKLLIKVISGSYAGSAGTDTEVIDNKFTFFIR